MKKKIKISLILSLAIIFGCFSNVFAASNQNNKAKKISEVKKSARVLNNATTDDGGVVGTSNLNGTAENSAKSGDQLLKPEIGWKRYDDTNKNISYSSNFEAMQNMGATFYLGTRHHALGKSNFTFKFVGKQFRIIADTWVYPTKQRTTDYRINIDGQEQQVNYPQTVSSSNKGLTGAIVTFTKTDLSNAIHTIDVISDDVDTSRGMVLDAIDIDSTGYLIDPSVNIDEAITLNKTTDSLTVGQTDILTATVTPDNATNKTVKWTSSDPTTVSVDENGNIKALKAGTATITATIDGTNLKTSCTVTVSDPLILNIEPEKTKINLNDIVSANLTIDNIQDIAAEDIRIKYDSTRLQFLNYAEVDGIKLVENDVKDGELRFILASKGKANIIDAKKILLKLNFKGIAAGDALVDVTNGRVSDGITKEWDLTDEQCGQATITIQKLSDVNNSGEYTLLDLGIDARHEGEDPGTLPQYNTDQDGNKAIDDDDLTLIGKYMLENINYTPNNIK